MTTTAMPSQTTANVPPRRLQHKIESWKEALLDGSRSNQLLFFKGAGARGSSALALTDATGALFTCIMGKGKASEISLTAEHLGLAPLEASADGEEEAEYQKQRTALFKRLRRLRDHARDALSNRGVNILYAAVGLLEWREAPQSAEMIRSPLLLIPVELKSKGGWSEDYALAPLVDGRSVINPTLREKLVHDFGITLPELHEDGALSAEGKPPRTVQEVVAQLRQALAHHDTAATWRVQPEVYLGLFTFQRQALYDDLVEHADIVAAHPIVRAICGVGDPPPPRAPVVTAERLDADVSPRETWQVLDADASQQEAIIAAKRGLSFVLQGPPGTGKSQTIANIIAECLADGKRILFVSEKMAAIEVVAHRLADAGLSQFCLNLHQRSAEKGERDRTYEALKAALNSNATGMKHQRDWETSIEALLEHRGRLNEYVTALHQRRSALHWSAFDVLSRLTQHRQTPDIACALPDPLALPHARLVAIETLLADLSSMLDLLKDGAQHPWYHTSLHDYTPSIAADLRALYDALLSALGGAQEGATALFALLGREGTITEETVRSALDLADFAATSPHPLHQWLHAERHANVYALAEAAQAQDAARRQAADVLSRHVRASLLDEPCEALQGTITSFAAQHGAKLCGNLDTLVRDADGWREQLTTAVPALDELHAAALACARQCGLPEPTSIAECGALAELGELLAQTSNPPPAWFAPEALASAQRQIAQVAKRYRTEAHQRATLAATYSQAIFACDLAVLHARMQHDHRSPLRFLRPSWHQDRKQIQACLTTGTALPPYATLAQHIALAADTRALSRELHDAEDEHRQELGPLFTGPTTDWEALRGQAEWVARLMALLQEWEWPLTPEIRTLAAQPKRRWADFLAQQERLSGAWAQWEPLGVAWERHLDARMLLGVSALNEALPAALGAELQKLTAALEPVWMALATLARHYSHARATTWQTVVQTLDLAVQARAARQWFAAQRASLEAAFGAWYSAETTDWAQIIAALEWCHTALTRHHGLTPPEAFINLVTDATLLAQCADLCEHIRRSMAVLPDLWRQSDAVLPRRVFHPGAEYAAMPLVEMCQRVQVQREAIPLLERWIALQSLRDQCAAWELGEFCAAFTRLVAHQTVPKDAQIAWRIFEKRFYLDWLTAIIADVPILNRFRGEDHLRIIKRFQDADRDYLKYARLHLGDQLRTRRAVLLTRLDEAPVEHSDVATKRLKTSLTDLRYQVNLKRRKPFRKLITRCGPAMQAILPCWMMSPLSVSEFIDVKAMQFDLVIFDEASQICAEDAISSIMRGRQLIVVGDEKQMPPSNGFRKMLTLDDAEDDEEDEDAADVQRAESILKECTGTLSRTPYMLRFHYRSRHESLIAFSNAHFYGGELVTFPSPQAEHRDGIVFHHLPDGVFDRGHKRINAKEVQKVVDLVLEHARTHPDTSLGVVAFNQPQQEAINEELNRRLKGLPHLREWFSEGKSEAFFVRNLESVQGDERDVIILSVGYARDHTGKMYQNFGPLNNEGGERRLNVAITRARLQMHVVTSLHASDILGKSVGAQTLRGYLDFAENGPSALATAATGEADEDAFDSDFEREVCQSLRKRGWRVASQVGCSGYRIDLAVRDPKRLDRYLLGIECDGATYHSAKTARDRDRLRQQQLEGLGWQILRIWSRDWLADPVREIARVEARLAELRA